MCALLCTYVGDPLITDAGVHWQSSGLFILSSKTTGLAGDCCCVCGNLGMYDGSADRRVCVCERARLFFYAQVMTTLRCDCRYAYLYSRSDLGRLL